MRIYLIYILCLFSFLSCEKIWIEDLKEQAYDTIRGLYEIESIIWEEKDPIDIDGDGEASFDYFAEWNKLYFGIGEGYNAITNDMGQLSIPYVANNTEYVEGEDTILQKWNEQYHFGVKAVIDNDTAHLEFQLPEDDCEFSHSGYGELTLRTRVTLTVIDESQRPKEISGTIKIKYIRTQYWCR